MPDSEEDFEEPGVSARSADEGDELFENEEPGVSDEDEGLGFDEVVDEHRIHEVFDDDVVSVASADSSISAGTRANKARPMFRMPRGHRIVAVEDEGRNSSK